MDKEMKETLQSIDNTLKRMEIILSQMERKQKLESSEEFYKKHGIIQTFA